MGGDLLVRGSVALARRLRVPPAIVAATVVGFGTSLPELVVSLQATLSGFPNLILGNVVGSNIANVLVVGGAAAVVYPLTQSDRDIRRSVVVMLLSLGAFSFLAAPGELSRAGGLALLLAFVAVIGTAVGPVLAAPKADDASIPLDWVLGLPRHLGMISVFILSGVVMLPLGADLLIGSSVNIAARLGVPDTVVGLTILAFGTSLPELVTTVLAALERRSDVALGAIVGSNTFNVLAITGTTVALSSEPIAVSTRFIMFDVPIMLAASIFLAFFVWSGRTIDRRIGIGLLLAYAVYLGTLYRLL
jgi:cation:H+ antiporter